MSNIEAERPYRHTSRPLSQHLVAVLIGVATAGCVSLGASTPAGAEPAGDPVAPIQLALPAPRGPYRLGTTTLHLLDTSRRDPLVPSRPVRELMVQLWYPARDVEAYPVAPWMTAGAAAEFERQNTIPPDKVRLPATHAHEGAPLLPMANGRPVVLFSPGAGIPRELSTAQVEDLAGRGYVVAAIDHTFDAAEIEFPGGRVERGVLPKPDTPESNATTFAARLGDTRFVLDQLSVINAGANPDAEHRLLPRGLPGSMDLSHIGMFGHSMGGATAAGAMHDDPRITAGIVMDGTLRGPVVADGLDQPLLLMGTPAHGRNTDPTWASTWAALRGWRRELRLTGSRHLSYTDAVMLYPQAAPVLGLTADQLAQLVGTVNPQRAVTVERDYIGAFFDLHLRHRDNGLLNGPSPCDPEMQFLP
jgi:dienelactone hydrolase